MANGAHARARRSPDEAYAAIQLFLDSSQKPALLEPGEKPMDLSPGNHEIKFANGSLTIRAWDRDRNFTRKVTGVLGERRGILDLATEHFGKREGTMQLLDLARPQTRTATLKGERQSFREVFRRLLKRQFPNRCVEVLTAEQDLQHSLPATYPRAILALGPTVWAAIAAPPSSDADGLLALALIWLDYVQRRETKRKVTNLLLWLPEGRERTTLQRLRWIEAPFQVFCYSTGNIVRQADPLDIGNNDTRLPPSGRAENIERVNGLEIARETPAGFVCTLDGSRHTISRGELDVLKREVGARRTFSGDRQHPLFKRAPEAWLESQVQRSISAIDAVLRAEPVYGQVPVISGIERGVMDLLAVSLHGQLCVIELKASEDLQLPVQALDYWMRVKWHLENGDFQRQGFFPGVQMLAALPKLYLVAPSLEFHPTTETILRYFSPRIDVERIGLTMDWRKEVQVVFRMRVMT